MEAKYLSTLNEFNKTICQEGLEKKYEDYLKDFRGDGYYLPETILGDVDKGTIGKYLPILKDKIVFISTNIEKLKSTKKLPPLNEVIKPIETDLKKLLTFKKDYFHEKNLEAKEKIKHQSAKYLIVFKKNYHRFLKDIYFLLSYDHPVDHLHNRHVYDSFNLKDGEKNKKRANETFFYRRIVEDGALDLDNQFPDIFLRSTLDTLTLAVDNLDSLITENIRYDLFWILKQVEKHFNRGLSKQIERHEAWLKKSQRTLAFYEDLLKRENQFKLVSIIENKHKASKNLKKLVFSKQAEIYQYWRKQEKILKKYFVLDIILYSEVGTVDGLDALERKEVIDVVKNRVKSEEYSKLDPKQELISYLKLKPEELENEKYLNALFKVGEFSFTYPYIIGVAKMFCPDFSKNGKKLRTQNLKLITDNLNSNTSGGMALRYFSRESMLGRIDMSTVWDDYIELPEKPGLKALDQKSLIQSFQKNKFEYFYDFTDENGVNYWVLSINKENYAMSIKDGQQTFFKHRNPHQFKYFKKK
jgi:hypothetical protein